MHSSRCLGVKPTKKKLIVPKFPTDITTYVEPFVGAGSIFFYKPKHKHEIINDGDPEISFFYSYIQRHSKCPAFPSTISKAAFERWRDLTPKSDTERFIRLFIIQSLSFRANRRSYVYAHTIKDFKRCKFVENYSRYHQRLQGVTILNADYREVIRRYNTRDAFFYLDPPYETGEHHDVTAADTAWYGTVKLQEIESAVRSIQGRWMLSFSANRELIRRLADFKIEIYQTAKSNNTIK